MQERELEPVFDEPVAKEPDFLTLAGMLEPPQSKDTQRPVSVSRGAPVVPVVASISASAGDARKKIFLAAGVGVAVVVVVVLGIVLGGGSKTPESAPSQENPVAVAPVPAVIPEPVAVKPPEVQPEPQVTPPPTAAPPQLSLKGEEHLDKAAEEISKALQDRSDAGRTAKAFELLCAVAEFQAHLKQFDLAKASYKRASDQLSGMGTALHRSCLMLVNSAIGTGDPELLSFVVDELFARMDAIPQAHLRPDYANALTIAAQEMVRREGKNGAGKILARLAASKHTQRWPEDCCIAMIHAVVLNDADAAVKSFSAPGVNKLAAAPLRLQTIIMLLARGKVEMAKTVAALTHEPKSQDSDILQYVLVEPPSLQLYDSFFAWRKQHSPYPNFVSLDGLDLQHADMLVKAGKYAQALEVLESRQLSYAIKDSSVFGEAMARGGRFAELVAMAELEDAPDRTRLPGTGGLRAGLLRSVATWSHLLGDEAKSKATFERMEKVIQTPNLPNDRVAEMSAHFALAQFQIGDEAGARQTLLRLRSLPRHLEPLKKEVALMQARLGMVDHAIAIAVSFDSKNRRNKVQEELYRAIALAHWDSGNVDMAMRFAALADHETVEQLIKRIATNSGVQAADFVVPKVLQDNIPYANAAIHLAMAKADLSPAPLATFVDPRPKPVDKSTLPALPAAPVQPVDEAQQLAQTIEMLSDPSVVVRQRACQVLAGIGGGAWPALGALEKAYVSDGDPSVQAEAAKAMRAILTAIPSKFVVRKPTVEVVTAVLSIADKAHDQYLKAEAIKCFDALFTLSADSALADAILPAYTRTFSRGQYANELTIKIAAVASPAAAPAIAAQVTSADEFVGYGSTVVLLQLARNKDISATFTDLLKKPDPIIRQRLVAALSHHFLQSSHSVASLLPLLKDSDANLRYAVIERIGQVVLPNLSSQPKKDIEKDVPHLKAAMEAARNDNDYATREAAVAISDHLRQPARPDGTRPGHPSFGLNPNSKKESLPRVMAVLRDPQQSEKSKLRIVNEIEHKDLPQALAGVKDHWKTLPEAARRLLAGKVRSGVSLMKSSRRIVHEILKDELEAATRLELQTVMAELDNIDDHELTSAGKSRSAFNDSFNNPQQMDEAAAYKVFSDPKSSAAERYRAIQLLGQKKPNEARSVQIFRVAMKHKHVSVRVAAAKALGLSMDAANLPHLLAGLDDWSDTVRREAVASAIRIDPDSPEVLKAFGKVMDDPYHWVRYPANQVLADHGSAEAMMKLIEAAWTGKSVGNSSRGRGENIGIFLAKKSWTPEQMKAVKELPPGLLEAIGAPQHSRQQEAIQLVKSMGGIGHTAVGKLIEVLGSPDSQLSREAQSALAAVAWDDADARKALAELATDPTFRNRLQAWEALRLTAPQQAILFPLIRRRAESLPIKEREILLGRMTYQEKNPATEPPALGVMMRKESRYDLPLN